MDGLLRLFFRGKSGAVERPKSVLVSNLAHLGDVILMTALLQVIRQTWPEVRIGVLVGSWARMVVEDHPCVDRVHLVDHWKLNRGSLSRWKKLYIYWQTKRQAVKEMRGYDLAIDGYTYFPNAIPLFWAAGIPTRIGYVSGGFGPLLTHRLEWREENLHATGYGLALLEAAGIRNEVAEPLLRPLLPSQPKKEEGNEYVVIHMGTGAPEKEWPLERWRELVQALEGRRLVFTGRGPREKEHIRQVMQGIKGAVNLCDMLAWKELLQMIQHAQLLIGVDSMAGHLAAVWEVPSILIYAGATHVCEWRPLNPQCQLLEGDISVDEVLARVAVQR